MQKVTKKRMFAAVVLAALLALFLLFAGCSVVEPDRTVTGIARAGSNIVVTYSDGTTETIDTVSTADVSAQELYEYYKEVYGEDDLTYADFLKLYLSAESDNSSVIGQTLLSSVKLYTEFYETVTTSNFWGRPEQIKQAAVYTGSGVIYKVEEEYTYIITNYHVVYSATANTDNAEDNPGGQNIAHYIACYLYGSEGSPAQTNSTQNGYPVYNYGSYAVDCEYVGGSLTKDIALVRCKTADLLAIREDLRPVTFADGYHVGETAIAIGNAEDEGISVTEGIVSVASEEINLKIDNTTRSYRSLRIDTAIYGGNSGGGLFNVEGELIGITNAGDEEDQNINFAIPVEIVQGVADNIYYYATDGDDSTVGAYTISLGITRNGLDTNSRYVYDSVSGYGKIVEDITVSDANSLAKEAGVQAGDMLKELTIDGVVYELDCYYDITDALLNVRPGSTLTITYLRDGQTYTSDAVTVSTDVDDLTQVA